MTATLALLGGKPVIEEPPRFIWPIVTEGDIKIVGELLGRAEIAYVGSHGKQLELEQRFAEYLGVRHALAVNSGTSALHSAYFALGLEPGDEVLVPTYTFISTVTPVFLVNAVPVLIDGDEWTGNLDPALLAEKITPRTKAIVVTHMNGFPVDMPAVMAVARTHGLKVIEDCSLAHGAICAGRKVGTWGDVAAFSLQSNKLVTAGNGGIMVTDDSRMHERAVLLGHFLDRSRDDVHSEDLLPFVKTGWGLNNRIHPVGAALAVESLSRLEDQLAIRRENCGLLDEMLEDIPGLRAPIVEKHMQRPVHYGYQPLYVPDELDGLPIDIFTKAAAAEGVPVSQAKTPPLHCMPAFQREDNGMITYGHFGRNSYRVYSAGDLPRSEAYQARVLRMPSYSQPEPVALRLIGEALAKVARNSSALHDWARDG